MSWFVPMDSWQGVRTANDVIHNNFITTLVIFFLISQLFAILYWAKEKNLKFLLATRILFSISLIFGLVSLWANINKSEIINVSERGWMLSFLAYIFLISFWAGREDKNSDIISI